MDGRPLLAQSSAPDKRKKRKEKKDAEEKRAKPKPSDRSRSPRPRPVPLPEEPKSSSKGDVELEKLELKRKAIVARNRWADKVRELNMSVSLSIERAMAFSDCSELLVLTISAFNDSHDSHGIYIIYVLMYVSCLETRAASPQPHLLNDQQRLIAVVTKRLKRFFAIGPDIELPNNTVAAGFDKGSAISSLSPNAAKTRRI